MGNQLNVLITGAISGFGRQSTEKLANDGYQIFATAREINGKNKEAAKDLEQWANDKKLNIKVIELDVSDEESVNQAVSSILNDAGHLDLTMQVLLDLDLQKPFP